MTVQPSALTAAILAVRGELVSTGRYASFQAINAGYCTDFCNDVTDRLGVPADAHEPFEVGIDNLMECEDDEPTVMDRALLAAHWPKIQPPEGLTWDEVDQLASDAGFSAGTHVWLCLDGRHYDAEAPEGVDNPFDLPFFQRVVGSWLEERPSPRP
jgi:hypothetical protein